MDESVLVDEFQLLAISGLGYEVIFVLNAKVPKGEMAVPSSMYRRGE